MSLTVVNVTVAADASPADPAGVFAEGNVVAVPSGAQWPDTNSNPIVPMVVHGTLVNGTCTIALVASDNFTAGVLTWDFIINIRGLPTVNVPGVQVIYANGASQNVWGILTAAGWTPTPQP
jgi:hypothetical protein